MENEGAPTKKLGCLKGRGDLDYIMYVYVAVLVQTGASLGDEYDQSMNMTSPWAEVKNAWNLYAFIGATPFIWL